MTEEDATANYLGRNQLPNDDVAAYHEAWQAAKEAVDARTPYNAATPQLEQLPPPLNDAREAFLQRPDVIAAFRGLDWSVGIVDLQHVLSFQKVIAEDAAEDRVAGIETEDFSALFSACLPGPVSESVGLLCFTWVAALQGTCGGGTLCGSSRTARKPRDIQ